MKMNQNKLFNRRTKAGTYAFILTAVVLGILIVVNLMVAALPTKYTVLDTSSSDIYTLSDTTEEAVRLIEEPITLYQVTTADTADPRLTTFLERYASLNTKIKFKKIDVTTNPTFLDAYTTGTVNDNSVVVESERRFKLIDYTEIFVSTGEITDYYTYLATGGQSGYTVSNSFAGENAVTSALDYVTTDRLPTVYYLSGHGESDLPDSFMTQLVQSNLGVEAINLLIESEVPENAGCILLFAPTADISTHEATLIANYLASGGRLFLMTDYRFDPAACPNLASIAANYGMTASKGVLMESKSGYYQQPYYLVPNVISHEITAELQQTYRVLAPLAHGLTVNSSRSSLQVSSLFTTTESAYMADPSTGEAYTDKQAFSIALAAEEEIDGINTKMIWLSGAQMLADDANSITSGGNYAYLLEMFSWMCEREQVISIPAVSMDEEYLLVGEVPRKLLSAVIIGVIPVAISMIGLVYWLRRRRR